MREPELPTAGGPTSLELDLALPLDRFDLVVDLRLELDGPVGLFGASGSGKTSLLEAVAGLRPAARGRIELAGRTWLDGARSVPPEDRRVGWVPQEGLLFPHRTVEGNLLSGARARPGPFVERIVALLELEPLRARPVGDLSGGERQRVALGRALCSRPRLLLLDEPFASLDLPQRRRILPLLERLLRELAVPTLLVTHDPVELQALCSEVVVLRDGAVAARGRPFAVLTDPRIFPLARGLGFASLLRGRVVETRGPVSRVLLDGSDVEGPGPELVAPAAPVGSGVVIALRAADVLLATGPTEGLSARNSLAARIVALDEGPHGHLARLRLDGGPELAAELTTAAVEELGLAVGDAVRAVFKTSSCRVVETPDSGGSPTGDAAG